MYACAGGFAMQKIKNPVYNQEQKLEFIRNAVESEGSQARAVGIFKATAPFEFEKGADLCTFSGEELNTVMDKVCGMRTRSRYAKKSVISAYIRWCVNKKKPNAIDNTSKINLLGDEKVKSMMVRNPEHLQICLNRVFDQEVDDTQDNTMRFFFWMAYGGMPEEKIVRLTAQDVDLQSMSASKEGSDAVIYRQGLPSITRCINLTQFLYRNQAYVNIGEMWRDRVPGNELIRGVRGSPSLANFRSNLSRKMRRARDEGISTEELTYSRVWLSGVFYRTYEREQAGIEPDFKMMAMYSSAGIRAVSSGKDEEIIRKSLGNLEFGIRSDYQRWKQAGMII